MVVFNSRASELFLQQDFYALLCNNQETQSLSPSGHSGDFKNNQPTLLSLMKLKNILLSTVIAPISILTIAACSSSDDDTDSDLDSTIPADVLLFDEATDGDIVDDPNNPQPLQFVVGDNRISGSSVSPDLDYVTVNVPAGSQLTAIELDEYISLDDQSFIAIQAGSVFTEPADAADAANLLGYAHFGEAMVGEDILTNIGEGQGSQEFTPPLDAGDYTFWIQEIGVVDVDYSMTFVVEETDL